LATTLIVTEKPDAALHVAEALSENESPKKINVDGVPFFETLFDGQRILVCSALGHLYAVAAREAHGHSDYPVWDYVWKPKHLVERGQERLKKWILAIGKVSSQADRFINGCDFDLEGSLIGYMVLKYACHGADAKAQRMKFSTLTQTELREAFANVLPQLDFPIVFAGMCRHEVDWLFGINLSRALTQSTYRAGGRYTTLSTGRVQGPTLRFLVERQREIETFVPTPFWIIKIKLDVDGQTVPAEYENARLERRIDASTVVEACIGKPGLVEKLESTKFEMLPPFPFDLSSLQNEAFRHFGLSPRTSLGVAERLYLDQLISYPRTSSQKLPPSIGYEKIIRGLGLHENYRSATSGLLSSGRLSPNEGKRVDPAHPAVYPTGTRPRRQLNVREQKLFDLIVRRFLATFGRTAVKRSDKASVKVDNYNFVLRGSMLIEKGWTALYAPYAKFNDTVLPPLRVGQRVVVKEIKSEQRFTQPPPYYNPNSLLRKMEDSAIGTKATRADIIETLYRRGYVTGQQKMRSTSLASQITEILTTRCPKVVDVTFTRELESEIQNIELGSQTRDHVVLETVEYLKPIIEALKAQQEQIGRELTAIISDIRAQSTTLLTPCPQCGSTLKVVKNPHTRKRFIGCSGKWKNGCKYTLPLPQLGTLSLLQKLCPNCGFQLIQVKSKGRRPLTSCCRCYANKANASQTISEPTVIPKPSVGMTN
jgi:DNA topoisomerase I